MGVDYNYNSQTNSLNQGQASAPPLQYPPQPQYPEVLFQQAPPPYTIVNSPQSQSFFEQKFVELINKYEITREFSDLMQKYLFCTKIVYVFDDSGSMSSVLNDSPLNTGVFKATRWDELKNFAEKSIDLANVFNPGGVDVYFLNRPPVRNARSINDLASSFATRPLGFTPLKRVMQTVLADNNRQRLGENKLLTIIVTDGEPTDDAGRIDIDGFKQVLLSRDSNTFSTIVSCTDEDYTMDYLNNWDRNIPRLDVVDDFKNERLEILKALGQNYRFSYGDYIVKTMIGSMDHRLDNLDEYKRSGDECCIVL
jgi:hypothetical protein